MTGKNVSAQRDMVSNCIGIFHISLSAGLSIKMPPVTIDLTQDASSSRVPHHSYSQEQCYFIQTFLSNLLWCYIVYANPSSVWLGAFLIVSMPITATFCLTVDPHSVTSTPSATSSKCLA